MSQRTSILFPLTTGKSFISLLFQYTFVLSKIEFDLCGPHTLLSPALTSSFYVIGYICVSVLFVFIYVYRLIAWGLQSLEGI